MTTKDTIGRQSVPFRNYDDLDDPKVLRVGSTGHGSCIQVEAPDGLYILLCPTDGVPLPNLHFHSVDKVSADMILVCRACHKPFEVGDLRIELDSEYNARTKAK